MRRYFFYDSIVLMMIVLKTIPKSIRKVDEKLSWSVRLTQSEMKLSAYSLHILS